jgi:hypothetical protein
MLGQILSQAGLQVDPALQEARPSTRRQVANEQSHAEEAKGRMLDFPVETKHKDWCYYSPEVLQNVEKFVSRGFVSKLETYPDDLNQVVSVIGNKKQPGDWMQRGMDALRRHFENCGKSFDEYLDALKQRKQPAPDGSLPQLCFGILPVVSIARGGREELFILSQVSFCHGESLYRHNDVRALKTDAFRGDQLRGETPWQTATRRCLIESAGLLDLATASERISTQVHPNKKGGCIFVVRIGFENERDLYDHFLLDFDRNSAALCDKERETVFGLALESFKVKLDIKQCLGLDPRLRFVQGAQFSNSMCELSRNIPQQTVWLRRHVLLDGKVYYKPVGV